MNILALVAVSALVVLLPVSAQAQGPLRGVRTDSGTAIDTTGGIAKSRHRSRAYSSGQQSYDSDAEVGYRAGLPSSGVHQYDVPSDFRVARGSRYLVTTEWPVLVDRNHRIVEVID